MLNHSFGIYRRISLLYARGIHISDILDFMGIKTVYVYGIGEMGKIVLSDLSDKISIPATFDMKAEEKENIKITKKFGINGELKDYSYSVFLPTRIPNDSTPILITPANNYQEISTMLKSLGFKSKRFLSLNLVLFYGMYYQNEIMKRNRQLYVSSREFLIVGGQFSNKGSQAMVFIAVNEIRKRYRDALVWFCPNFWDNEYRNEEKYKMIFLVDGTSADSTLYEVLPRLDGMIDVSGYALASHGKINATERYMNYLRMAKEFEIPIYIMPQSFGPFDYDDTTIDELQTLLSYAKVIYAREQSGYNLLTNTFDLTNVRKSKDLVLQNKDINLNEIYTEAPAISDIIQRYKLSTENNVAIIPNMQNYNYGNQKKVLQLYIDIIWKLLSLGKEVYIISHLEDEIICTDIYNEFQENEKVHLYSQHFDCVEFTALVKNFQYLVASRFHSIVHAYKEFRPCVVIGWAEKYKALLKDFKQEKYMFDVRKQIDNQEVLSVIEYMDHEYINEAKVIFSIIPEMQKENCFEVLDELD